MPIEPLATLGGFAFAADSAAYGELQRMARYRWEAQERIGSPPARQYLGPGSETVELSGTIYSERRRADADMDDLRAMAASGEPRRLVLGTGEILGLWAIERIRETRTVFLPGGGARKVEFRISLAWYGEAGAAEQGVTASAAAPAVPYLSADIPSQLRDALPADELPVELSPVLAQSLPSELPQGLADGRGGAYGAVLSALADGGSVDPRLAGWLKGQVNEALGRLDLERSYLESLAPGGRLPDARAAESVQAAQDRVDALQAVTNPPLRALRRIGLRF